MEITERLRRMPGRVVGAVVLVVAMSAAACGTDAPPEPTGPPQAEIEQAYHSGYLYGFRLARKVEQKSDAEAGCLDGGAEWPAGPERDEFERGCVDGWKESR